MLGHREDIDVYTHRDAAATALDVLMEGGLIDVATCFVVSHYWLGLMASD